MESKTETKQVRTRLGPLGCIGPNNTKSNIWEKKKQIKASPSYAQNYYSQA